MLHPKRSPRSRFVLTLLAAVLMLGLAAGCGKKEEKVVAEYDGGQITTKEFKAYKTFIKIINPTYASIVDEDSVQKSILDQFIGIRVLSSRASDEAKKQGKAEVETQFDAMKKSLESNAETKKSVEKTMKDGGLTYDQMKGFILEQFTMQKDAELKVTDADISAYYDKNKDKFAYATVRHILVQFTDKEGKERKKEDALKIANDVKGKLEAGGDWTALAKEYSEDPGSADNGGLYEKANPDQWVEAFKNAAKTLPLNTISDPIETEYGYHVMKVEARGTKTLEESKADILSTLSNESISKFMSDELPKLIKSTNLPKPSASPSPSASASASATPSASASASPSASSSASK